MTYCEDCKFCGKTSLHWNEWRCWRPDPEANASGIARQAGLGHSIDSARKDCEGRYFEPLVNSAESPESESDGW